MEPPVSFEWCAPDPAQGGLSKLEIGDECSLRFGNRCYLGRLVLVSRSDVVLRPWGAPGTIRLRRKELVAGSRVGAHTFEQRVAVNEKQYRGEPAWIIGRKET